MTPEQVEKAAEKYVAQLPTYNCSMCNGQSDYALEQIYISGASLVMERCKRLEAILKQIREDAAIVHDDALYTLCDAALEGKES